MDRIILSSKKNGAVGLRAAGWSPDQDPKPNYQISVDGRFQDPSREVISRFARFAIIDLQAHDDAVAFLQPVNADEVPDYAEIIKVLTLQPAWMAEF